MRQIIVEPSRLEAVALKIEANEEEYKRLYQHLFQEVDKMESAWQGKDNVAFVNQIYSFQEDFHQISILLCQYADFLRNSARAYRETQDELQAQAQRLYH